jgi:hypothetical protein
MKATTARPAKTIDATVTNGNHGANANAAPAAAADTAVSAV